MRKWLWILFFPLAAHAAGEGTAGKQHGSDPQQPGRCYVI